MQDYTEVNKILKIPPEGLSENDKMSLRFNSFIFKVYCSKWGNGITYSIRLKAA